jgi:hypothetical protein
MEGITGGGECDKDKLVFTIELLLVTFSSRSSYKPAGGGGGGGGIFSSDGGGRGGLSFVSVEFFLDLCCFFFRFRDFPS